MTHDLELELQKKYPKILKDCGGDMRTTCMHWWLETEDGWFKLVEEGLEKIQYLCDVFTATHPENPTQLVAEQIKSKLATLHFYKRVEGGNEVEAGILRDIVDAMAKKSARVCETSGEHGSLCVRGGWLKTLSYDQAREQGYKAADESLEEYWKEKDAKNKREEAPTDES